MESLVPALILPSQMITARALKRYSKQLCKSSPACVSSWESASNQLAPFLPKEDPHVQFKSCAVVSSAQQMVPKPHSHAAGRTVRGTVVLVFFFCLTIRPVFD